MASKPSTARVSFNPEFSSTANIPEGTRSKLTRRATLPSVVPSSRDGNLEAEEDSLSSRTEHGVWQVLSHMAPESSPDVSGVAFMHKVKEKLLSEHKLLHTGKARLETLVSQSEQQFQEKIQENVARVRLEVDLLKGILEDRHQGGEQLLNPEKTIGLFLKAIERERKGLEASEDYFGISRAHDKSIREDMDVSVHGQGNSFLPTVLQSSILILCAVCFLSCLYGFPSEFRAANNST
ncbi:hypothetical protein CYMTET_5134 [Cymbomonas tetramitiformis]|uniref:Uncharacterized protein n=1 Tax=Cymbomonas tetramitiformis TaxID=36881 RepID=A0AAE0H001_9CHLO|nr:hypothetical protein CYMTET_5134 [Cymbomonas tetramitiformis]